MLFDCTRSRRNSQFNPQGLNPSPVGHWYFKKGIDMKLFKQAAKYGSTALILTAGAAHAAVDYTPITGAFTAADIVTGIMAIAAVLAVVYVAMKGVKIVLGMLRGG